MKNISIIILLIFFVSTFAYSQDDKKQKKTPEEKAEILTAKMEKGLALTTDQVKKVKAINLSSAEKTVNARNEASGDKAKFHQQRDKIEKDRNAELKAVLTPEQYTKFEAMLKEQEEKKDNKGKKSKK